MSMNSPSSANLTISSYFSSSFSRCSPAARPPSRTLSRPDRFLLKPTPSASSVLTRPYTSIRPDVGGRIPAIVRTSVDLPAPFAPTIPSTVPCGIENETSLTASTSRTTFSPRPRLEIIPRSVGRRSNDVRYVTDTSWTTTLGALETDSELTLPRDEEEEADDQQPERPRARDDQLVRRRRLPQVDRLGPRGQQLPERVDVEQELVLLGHLVGEVEDGRREQPDPQQVRHQVLEVAEVDLQRGDEHRQPARHHQQQREQRDGPQQARLDAEAGRDMDRHVDDHRRHEALRGADHRRDREQHAGERAVEDQPPASDDRLGAVAHRVRDEVVREDAGHEVGEEARAVGAAAQDVDEDEVDAREHQRVEHQPELPEHRVEVLRAQLRPRQLDRECSPAPRLADVRPQRRQTHEMRLVDVVLLREVVLALVGWGGGGHVALGLHDGRPARAGHPQERPP